MNWLKDNLISLLLLLGSLFGMYNVMSNELIKVQTELDARSVYIEKQAVQETRIYALEKSTALLNARQVVSEGYFDRFEGLLVSTKASLDSVEVALRDTQSELQVMRGLNEQQFEEITRRVEALENKLN